MFSSIVIEDAMKRFEAGQSPRPVYFYCARSAAEPERSHPDAIMASLLRQLLGVCSGMPILPSVAKMYGERGAGFKSKGLDLEESRDLILQLIETHDATTIIVDALDECDSGTRQDLLDAFEEILSDSSSLVKIFVSSRDNPDIVDVMREYPNMSVSSGNNAVDIESFVKTETKELVRKRKLLRNSGQKEEMQELIIHQIIKGAEGMYVHLLLLPLHA